MPERGRTKWTGSKARFKEMGGTKFDTIITGHLTQEQLSAYQQYFRIEEISDLLRRGAKNTLVKLMPSYNAENFQRDPSPPPQYDQSGNRTNTRETRLFEQLEKERHNLVEIAVTTIKNYDPPGDYQKPAKTSEKLYIPIKDYPDINFVGLLLGPRGNTLRQLQEDSGAKLAIRGKGSVKDGKLDTSGEDELHVLISADTSAKIHHAIKLTNEVIEKAISSPAGQNDMKRDQLRELAILNGTLRETKPYVPPEMFDSQRRPPGRDLGLIVCRICGNVGHYSRDCKMRDERDRRDDRRDDRREERDDRKDRRDDRGEFDSYSPKRAYDQGSQPWKRPKVDLWVPPWMPTSAPPGHAAYNQQNYYPPPPNNYPPPSSTLAPPPRHTTLPPPPSSSFPPAPTTVRPPPGSATFAPPPPTFAPPPPTSTQNVPPPPGARPPPPPTTGTAPPPPTTGTAPPPPTPVTAPPPPPSLKQPPPPPS